MHKINRTKNDGQRQQKNRGEFLKRTLWIIEINSLIAIDEACYRCS